MALVQWDLFVNKSATLSPAMHAHSALGKLSPYWLSDTALQTVADACRYPDYSRRPLLPVQPGCCCITFANKDARTYGLLRKAMPLPLRWKRGTAHDDRLPRSVHALATSILQEKTLDLSGTDWSLHFSLDEPELIPDLSTLDDQMEDVQSGWVSLAAGLKLADWNLPPQSTVWASAIWQRVENAARLMPVKSLEHKIPCAAEHGAETFFVHPENSDEAKAIANKLSRTLSIDTLQSNGRTVKEALGQYFKESMIPLDRDSPVEYRRRQYELCYQLGPAVARDYYLKHLLPDIVHQIRRLTILSDVSLSRLVTIASASPELVAIADEIIRPERTLVLFTDDEKGQQFRAEAEKILRDDQRAHTQFEPVGFGDSLIDDFRTRVADFVADIADEQIVFDLTPGQTLMKLAIVLYVSKPRNYFACLESRWNEKLKCRVPFGEQYILWRADSEWQFPSELSETTEMGAPAERIHS